MGLMKDGLYRKIMTQFAGLRTKIYSYLIAYSDENDKAKRHKQLCQKNNNNNNNLNLKIVNIV